MPYIRRALNTTASVAPKYRSRGTPSEQKQIDIAIGAIEGVSRISHMTHRYSPIQRKIYHNQATYSKYLKKPAFRSTRCGHSDKQQDAMMPWFKVYQLSPVRLLQQSNFQFILPYVEHRSVIAVIDLSTLTVWSKRFEHATRGYGIPVKQWGYQLASLYLKLDDATGLWSYMKLAPGNETSQRLFETLINELNQQREIGAFHVKVILMDAGFASKEHFLMLDHLSYKFVSAVPRRDYLENLEFKPVYEVRRKNKIRQYAEAYFYLDGVKLKVIRSTTIHRGKKGKEKKRETHFFVSNLVEMEARKIMKLYDERWSIENNLFKELKSGCRIRIPSKKFISTVIYLLLVQLGFNIYQMAMRAMRDYGMANIRGITSFQQLVCKVALIALEILSSLLTLKPPGVWTRNEVLLELSRELQRKLMKVMWSE